MTDPLLDTSPLPFGAPAFDRIAPDMFLPAFARAIPEAWDEIEEVATDPAPPTFANVIEALERTGARLARVRRIFWTLSSAQAEPAIRAIEPEVSALLTRHGIRVGHDERLFARVRAVWEARETLGLNEAQRRLLDGSYRGFAEGGALLDAAGKARYALVAERLSELSTRFGQNLLACTAEWEMLLTDDDLGGVPASMREATAARAASRGYGGRYLVTLDRGDMEAFLTFSTHRDLRERLWRAFTGRCDGGAHDNRAIIDEMLALRQERAAMLGYASHADYALVDSMAKTPDAAEALLMRIWAPALVQATSEQAELQAFADEDGITLAAWDWRFYAERLRCRRFAVAGTEIREHLTLEAVRDAAFAIAGRLYGLTFTRRDDLPGWHPDVSAWAVSDGAGDRGLLYTDFFARVEKHGGAWMGALRVQERLDVPVLPIVYMVANFARAENAGATTLSIDEARTLFHEFGHALHALLSDVTYPSQSGTAVARDFVEFPSKFMEHWIVAPETLTALGMPRAVADAITGSDDFGQGFATVELTASSLLDMAVHRSRSPAPDSARIAAETLSGVGMPAIIAPRHGLTHFSHIFDGGYAGSYYSYLWSEVLDADAFAAFTKSGDLFDPVLADRFRHEILARGDTRDPMESFVALMHREPDETALLRERRLIDA